MREYKKSLIVNKNENHMGHISSLYEAYIDMGECRGPGALFGYGGAYFGL